MTHLKFSPFSSAAHFNRFGNLEQALDQVVNRGVNSFFSDEVKNWLTAPSVNILESKENFRIDVAAPGLTKEDFKIDVTQNVLTIFAEKKVETPASPEIEIKTTPYQKYVRREFGYSAFKRSFNLPENVDVANISAQYNNGVLEVSVPKIEPKIIKHEIVIK